MEQKKIKYMHAHKCKDNCSCHHVHELIKENKIEINDNTLSFKIEGLDCPSCAASLEDKLKKLHFIKNINIVFTTNTIYIELLKPMTIEKLIQTLNKEIKKIEPDIRIINSEKTEIINNKELIKNNVIPLIGILIFIITNIFLKNIIPLFFISYILIGYKILYKAGKNIINKNPFDENFLMSIATIGALIIGEYFEANAVLIFYLIGELLQVKATTKAKASINSLIDNKKEYANKKTNNGLIKIESQNIEINDILIIKPGERFPVDGIIISGNSSIDTSSLTGESMPVNINIDDKVLAGSINIDKPVELKATKTYNDSAVSKIIKSIEDAAASKSKSENFITKFSRIYTPAICILAALVFLVYSLLYNNLYDGAYKALTFLVISCPCALVISVPLSIYTGIGLLSKIGVLTKGGEYLEKLKDIKIIAFDKTGTLTEGKFSITSNHPKNLDKYIAHAEYYSSHPIAKSILKSYKHINIEENLISDFKEHKGLGVEAVIDNSHVAIGSLDFMVFFGIVVPVEDMYDNLFIIKDKKYMGSIILKDNIKSHAYDAVYDLKKLHISSVILTGDNTKEARAVANALEISTVYSSLLPWEKVEQIEKLIKYKKAAFVGDGINDAPVLKRSDIGFAIGDIGSDIAISAADMILLKNDLTLIPKAIKISKRVNKIIKENIFFTLLIKFIILFLALLGYAPMLLGVFADVGVTLLAVLNTFRIKKPD